MAATLAARSAPVVPRAALLGGLEYVRPFRMPKTYCSVARWDSGMPGWPPNLGAVSGKAWIWRHSWRGIRIKGCVTWRFWAQTIVPFSRRPRGWRGAMR